MLNTVKIAILLQKDGRTIEAEPLLKETLASQQRVLGSHHPDIDTRYC